MNIDLGLFAEFGHVEGLRELGLGWGSPVESVVFVALGWLECYRLSAPAFPTAFVLLIFDGITSIGSAVISSHNPVLGGLFMRVFIYLIIFRGMKADRQLRNEE